MLGSEKTKTDLAAFRVYIIATVLSDIKILIQHSKRAQWAWYAIPWLPSVISRSVILWGRWICLTYLIWSSYFPDIPCNVFVGVSRKFRMLCCQHLNRAASRFAQQCHNLSGHLSSLEPNNYAYKFSNLTTHEDPICVGYIWLREKLGSNLGTYYFLTLAWLAIAFWGVPWEHAPYIRLHSIECYCILPSQHPIPKVSKACLN